MRRLVLLVPTLLALLAVSPARARAVEPGLVLGERAFGKLACGVPTVSRAPFTALDTLAGADPAACEILLNRRYAPHMPRAMRCTLVMHEFGHLAGREHSHGRDSVMSAEYVREDPRCVAASRAGRAAGTWGSARRSG
jgi:hypothetical protein